MSFKHQISPCTSLPQSAQDASSWLALLTATTLPSHSEIVRAEVRTSVKFDGVSADRPHRLVVQLYPQRGVVEGRVQSWARPSASAQRAVTREDLTAGVRIHLVDFERLSADTPDRNVVVAWVEDGEPDLDLDGIGARPSPGCLTSMACLHDGTESVTLELGVSGRQAA